MNRLRVSLTDAQVAALEQYATLVLDANERASLTSSGTDREAIYERHFAEALALLSALDERSLLASPLIDIGTGAGFPGLVMKIARPELDVTLLEATAKKADFLREVIEELKIDGADVVSMRAEDAAHDTGYRGRYPLAVARAVAPLRVLLELTLPFLQIGGVLAAPKGSAAPREVREADHAFGVLHGDLELVEPLEVPGMVGPVPSLVIVRKVGETPSQYPRRPGMPAKRPL